MIASIRVGLALGAVTIAFAPANSTAAAELASPFRVAANGKPIDVEIGHAAPYMMDFDGDGLNDLLVGQFGDGKLRIFRNEGSRTEPKFGEHTWFKAGGADARVPAG